MANSYHVFQNLLYYSRFNLTTGSKACEKLRDIVSSKYLIKDMRKLSFYYQTSNLESYHSVVNHFAPKLLAFSHTGIHCRLFLKSVIKTIYIYQLHVDC